MVQVERSLESGIFVDQLVEVEDASHASPGYWLARVVTTCGPLLRYCLRKTCCIIFQLFFLLSYKCIIIFKNFG